MTSEPDDWDVPADGAWDSAPALAVEPAPLPEGLELAGPEPLDEGRYAVISLDPVMRAEALLEALLGLPPGTPLRINAGAVTRLSLPLLQVILSACRTAEAAGERLGVIDPSFAFSLAFEAFGFGPDNEPYTVEYA